MKVSIKAGKLMAGKAVVRLTTDVVVLQLYQHHLGLERQWASRCEQSSQWWEAIKSSWGD